MRECVGADPAWFGVMLLIVGCKTRGPETRRRLIAGEVLVGQFACDNDASARLSSHVYLPSTSSSFKILSTVDCRAGIPPSNAIIDDDIA